MSEGSLSKRIPARTHTEKFTWIRPFMEMSQQYRDIRKKTGDPMDKCFWCKHPFKDGEQMHMCGRPKKKNVLLCDSCQLSAVEEPK